MSVNSLPWRRGEKTPSLAQPSPKLSIPIIPREFLKRPRLHKRFDDALFRKLILVTAPAGYGKTIFLCEALGNVNRPIAWLSLDKRDDYLVRFWAGFIMALQKVQPGLGEHTLAMLRFRKPAIELALTELINEISEAVPDLIIVLDDYHEISLQAIHDSMAFLVDYLPPQVRLFIASRVDPLLPLARIRGRGHLAEIKASDLQFTQEETHSFLNEVMGLALTKEQVDYIHDRTEGWIAGLQMVAVSMQGRCDVAEYVPSFNGTNKDVMEYLTKEVLNQQEEYIRRFLLQTCILERLTESLCNAVTGRDDSQRILEQLVANHLFLQPLDEEGRWFRYHQLFSDLLYRQLGATPPGILAALHSQASEWYESQGLMEDAIEHALAAEKFDRAADLIQSVAFEMLGREEHTLLKEWIDKLPERLVAQNLRICLAGAITADAERQFDNEERYRQCIETIMKSTPEKHVFKDSGKTSGLVAFVLALGAYYKGSFNEAITIGLDSLESLPSNEELARCVLCGILGAVYWAKGELQLSYNYWKESTRLAKKVGYNYVALVAVAAMAHINFARGHLKSAEDMCIEAIQLATDSSNNGELTGTSYAYLLLGEILYQKNYLDDAAMYINRAIELGQRCREPVICLNGYLALARINLAKGKSSEAVTNSRQARMVTYEDDSRNSLITDVFMTHFCLRQGNVREAMEHACNWIDFQDNNIAQSLTDASYWYDVRDIWCESPYITMIRVYFARNEIDKLPALLEDVYRQLVKKQSVFYMIECLILKALIYNAQAKVEEALETLKQVFAMTENEGYIRVFIDEGQPMLELLKTARTSKVAPDYVRKLIKSFRPSSEQGSHILDRGPGTGHPSDLQVPAEPNFIVEPLSKRELEILHLIKDGLTNKEISNRLPITVSTVKSHIFNIYQKLDASNRSLAVLRAQQMGLL